MSNFKSIILENRSLAENSVYNLLQFHEARLIFVAYGEKQFESLVWKILDANE